MTQEKKFSDRRFAVLGGAIVVVSIAGVVLHSADLLPQSATSGITLAATAIGLRLLLLWTARSASPETKTKVLNVVSLAGLAVSGMVLVLTLPHITGAGGVGLFLGDAVSYGWTLALLLLAAGGVRTLTWRVFLGAGLAGLLAVSAVVRFAGLPVAELIGLDTVLAAAGWVPLLEEVLKSALVLLVVLLAARQRDRRPSALDLTMLGAWTGAGFALYENAMYGRGGPYFATAPPFSILFPSQVDVYGSPFLASGHLVWTSLVGLGLGISVLYRHHWRLAWLAAPLAFVVAVFEHGAGNGIIGSEGSPPVMISIMAALTLNGYLSSLMLVGGVAAMGLLEWRGATRHRAPHPSAPPPHSRARSAGTLQKQVRIPAWLRLASSESERRGAGLASLQRRPDKRPSATTHPTPAYGGNR